MDNSYEKSYVVKYVEFLTRLDEAEKHKVRKLLFDFEDLFDRILGDFDTKPVSLKFKEDAKRHHVNTYTVLKVLKKAFKKTRHTRGVWRASKK